jgi:hypothetical protein
MAKDWDSDFATGDELTADEWDQHVTDQKNHSARHEDGGTDELDVSGLSGVLSDAQTPQTEAVEDIVDGLLQASGNIALSYDDGNNTLTIDTSALNTEEVEDAVAALVTAGNAITVNYDDGNDSLSIAVDESSLSFYDGTNLTANVDNQSVSTDRAVLTEDADLSEDDAYLQTLVDKVGSDGTVRIPRGAYTISAAVDLSGYDGLTLTAPRGARLVASSSSVPSQLLTADGTNNITISGVTLDLNSQATTGLRTFNCRAWDVESNYVTGGTASGSIGIDFDGDSTNTATFRRGSTIRANQILGGDIGIRFGSKSPQYSEIYGNIAQASGSAGVKLSDAENVGITANHVTNYDSGFFVETSLKNDLLGNRANHVTNGIRFKGASGNDGNRALFNKCNVTSGHSILLNGATNAIVARNAIGNTDGNFDAIHLQFLDTTDCIIENNQLGWRNAAGNTAITEESDVSGNVFRNNVTRISGGYSFNDSANASGNISI